MNSSLFIFYAKLKEAMRLRLDEQLGIVVRLAQAFLWSILFAVTSLPVAYVSGFLADLAGKGSIAESFWLIVGMLAVMAGVFGCIFLLISFPCFILWSFVMAMAKDTENPKKDS